MKFIIDECIGPTVAQWLKQCGYDVISVYEKFPGAGDNQVLDKAFAEKRILITSDKDFGEIIFRNKRQHFGVILLRLLDERPIKKISVIEKILATCPNELSHENFIVATETAIKISKSFKF